MADRSVTVRLTANVNGYERAITKAQMQTRDFGKEAEKAALKQKKAWDNVGKGMLVTGGLVAAGVGIAVKTFADFDKAMSRAQAGTMATGKSLAALRAAAIDAGAKTQFSATEAADAITAMGKAGVSVKDILGGGLNASLSLAAAGELDVGKAAEIAATAMTQFGLQGKDLPHVADLLAAGAGKAQGSVDDLASALKYVGPVSKGLGVSIEETTGVLAEFASQGIIGEQAGTSLRGVMLALTSPSKIAAKEMATLGISVYDAAGHFVGMDGVAGQLQTKLGGLSEATRNQALGQIFGNEQITAARILYSGGAKAVTDWTSKVNDAGFAARQAAMLTNNWQGDIERLGGSLSSVFIQSGSAANDMLRSLTKELQSAVDLFGSAPPEVQKTALRIGAVGAASLLAGGAFLTLLPKVLAAKADLVALGITSEVTGNALRTVGKAGGIALVGLAALEGINALTRMNDYSADVDKLTTSLRDLGTEAIKAGANGSAGGSGLGDFDLQAKKLFNPTQLNAGAKFNSMLEDLTGYLPILGTATDKAKDSFKNYDDALSRLVSGGNSQQAAAVFQTYGEDLKRNGATTAQVTALFPKYQQALAEAASQTDAAATATGNATSQGNAYYDTIARLASETQTATFNVKGFDDALKGLFNQTFSVESATDSFHTSLNDLSKAVKDNGRSIEGNTPKAIANREALRTTAQRAYDLVQAYADTGASSDKVVAKSKTLKDEFVQQAMKAGYSRSAAEHYAGALNAIPKTVKSAVSVTGIGASLNAAQTLSAALLSIKDRHVSVSVTTTTSNKLMANPKLLTPASGGYVTGPGTGTSDSIPAMLSNGEYVIKASAVRGIGVPALHAMNNRYAKGGVVGTTPTPPPYVAPDFSAITGRLTATPPTGDEITALRTKQAHATQALHAAELALEQLRKNKHRTSAQVALDEERIKNARVAVQAATTNLRGAEAARAGGSAPLATQVVRAATGSNAATAKFLTDVGKLRAMGFTALADQLMMAADAQAYTLAHQAAGSKRTANSLQGRLIGSAVLAAKVSAGQSAISNRAQLAADAVTAAADRAKSIAGNRAQYEFDGLTPQQQVADLDTRLAAEQKYTDAWMTLNQQRQGLVDQLATKEQAAKDEATKAAADYATMIAANKATYAFEHSSVDEQITDLTRRIDAEAGYTDTWMALTSQRAALQDQVAAAAKQAAADAAKAAADYASMIDTNRAAWVFDHATVTEQIADLDRRIGAEQQYTDTWVSLSNQRAQAAAALDAQTQPARDRAATLTTFAAGKALSVRNTAAFYANLQRLADRGYKGLASALLDQSDEQAELVAEQAASASDSVVSSLGTDIASIGAQDKQRQALADSLKGVVAVEQPTWSLPQLIAGVYGSRPAAPQTQSIVVKIGERELDAMMYSVVDGHMVQLADGLVYGSAN